MTLREKVAWAICAADCRGDPHVCDMDDPGSHCKPEVCSLWRNYRNGADAALAVVREALREPDEAMLDKGQHVNSEWLNNNAPLGERRYREPAKAVFLGMLAASPLAEGNGDD